VSWYPNCSNGHSGDMSHRVNMVADFPVARAELKVVLPKGITGKDIIL